MASAAVNPALLTPRSRRSAPPNLPKYEFSKEPEPVAGAAGDGTKLSRHESHVFRHGEHSDELPDIQLSERIVNVNPAGLATAVRLNLLAGHAPGHAGCDDEDGLVSCSAVEDLEREFERRREPLSDQRVQLANIVRHYVQRVFRDGRFRHSRSDIPSLAERLIMLADTVADILDNEPRLLRLDSPIYVLGDIHGNFEDLSFFVRHLSTFGEFDFTPHKILFLGDYVDRGLWGVESSALLLAIKAVAPHKVFLLRGNHEFAEINGAVNSYGKSSFLSQCSQLFGGDLGFKVWSAFNNAFKHLPLAAIVDNKVFCVHGGIPRRSVTPGDDSRLETISDANFPRFAYTTCSKNDRDMRRLLMTDLMWSDPMEGPHLAFDRDGFCTSDRGPTLSAFGDVAISNFFTRYNFQLLVRAHEHKKVGLRVSNHRRVLTVFSSSAYCGTDFGASSVFLSNGVVRIVTKEVTRNAQIAYSHYDEDEEDDAASQTSTASSSVGHR